MKLGNALLIALLILPGWGCQVSTDMLATPATRTPTAGQALDGDPLDEPGPPPGPAPDRRWAVDFLLGLPTEVRLQRDLLSDNGRALVVEGFAGLGAIFPEVGGGIRYRLPLRLGCQDALAIAPGADVYVLGNPFHGGSGILSGGPATIPLFALDTDLMWQHAFSAHSEGEFGIKLGVGAAAADRAVPVPIVSVFSGWRF
jgi:hypothetical protein